MCMILTLPVASAQARHACTLLSGPATGLLVDRRHIAPTERLPVKLQRDRADYKRTDQEREAANDNWRFDLLRVCHVVHVG